jgi:hypothetical protein
MKADNSLPFLILIAIIAALSVIAGLKAMAHAPQPRKISQADVCLISPIFDVATRKELDWLSFGPPVCEAKEAGR